MSLEEKISNAKKSTFLTDGLDPSEVKSIVINAKIGNKIRNYREDHNIARADFANMVGVRVYNIAKWEGEGYNFTVEDLCKLSNVMDIEQNIIEIFSDIKNNKGE